MRSKGDSAVPSVEDLHRMVPDRDAYDRAFAAAVRKQTDLLLVNEMLHVPRNGPRERMTHLAPLTNIYERAELAAAGLGPPVFALISAPPQSGKTALAETSFARWLSRRPQDSFGWLSYGAELSRQKSMMIRDYALRLGVKIRRDAGGLEHWVTEQGGGLLAKGLNGPITGMSGLSAIMIDDPYSGPDKALSASHRRWIRSQVNGAVFGRLQPRTSVFIQHHRWAVDDLIGWAKETLGDLFADDPVVIPAVDEMTDEPLVTFGGRDRTYYARQKSASMHLWWPLYMGTPRPDDGSLFRQQGVNHYEVRPTTGQTTIGLDFAYSTSTKSDWSVAIVLRRVDQRAYVLEVLRMRVEAPKFAEEVRKLSDRYGGAPLHAYAGGTEKAVEQFWAALGIRGLTFHAASRDKFSRALATATAWNAGNILIPENANWTGDFVAELLNFGAGGHDDQVDALAGAYDFNQWVGSSIVGLGAQPRRVTSYGGGGNSLREKLEKAAQGGAEDRQPDIEQNFHARPTGGGGSGWKPGSGGKLPTRHGW